MDLILKNSKQLKRTSKIISLYVIGLLCLGVFFYMDNSKELSDFLNKADRFRTDWGFGFYAIAGLIKMVSLISGVLIPLVLTIMIKRQKLRKNAQ